MANISELSGNVSALTHVVIEELAEKADAIEINIPEEEKKLRKLQSALEEFLGKTLKEIIKGG